MDDSESAIIAGEADLFKEQTELYKEVFHNTYEVLDNYNSTEKIVITSAPNVEHFEPTLYNKRVYVVSIDIFDACYSFVKNKKRVLLVSKACSSNRGGGVQTGASGNEAEICRRSTYWRATRQIKDNYPLNTGALVYAENIQIFKSGIENNYTIHEPFSVDLLNVVLPSSPICMTFDGKDTYEHVKDKRATMNVLAGIMNYSSLYDVIIINNLGTSDAHPIDEFIELLYSAIHSTLSTCANFVLVYSDGKHEQFMSDTLKDVFHKIKIKLDTEDKQYTNVPAEEQQSAPVTRRVIQPRETLVDKYD